jgi:hypothetical protein
MTRSGRRRGSEPDRPECFQRKPAPDLIRVDTGSREENASNKEVVQPEKSPPAGISRAGIVIEKPGRLTPPWKQILPEKFDSQI